MLHTLTIIKGTVQAVRQNGRAVEIALRVVYPKTTLDVLVEAWDDVGERVYETIRSGQYVLALIRYANRKTEYGETTVFKLDDPSNIALIMSANPPLSSVIVEEPSKKTTRTKPTPSTSVPSKPTPSTPAPSKPAPSKPAQKTKRSSSGLPRMRPPVQTPGIITPTNQPPVNSPDKDDPLDRSVEDHPDAPSTDTAFDAFIDTIIDDDQENDAQQTASRADDDDTNLFDEE